MRSVLIAAVCVLVLPGVPGAAEVVLFRTESKVYVVPDEMGTRMLQLARREDWKLIGDLTRRIDADGDGVDDYVAIGMGARSGYGAQLRFRLRSAPEETELRIGSWYWGVIIDPDGARAYEAFNP